MDLTELGVWLVVGASLFAWLWRQRRLVRTYMAAQREVLERQKESMKLQSEAIELQRESVRLLGVIAKALEQQPGN
jgi:hypothetical protein